MEEIMTESWGKPKRSWDGSSNWALVVSSNVEWQPETGTKTIRSFKSISLKLFSKFHDLETPWASYNVMKCLCAISSSCHWLTVSSLLSCTCVCFFCVLLFSIETHLQHFLMTELWDEYMVFSPLNQRSSCCCCCCCEVLQTVGLLLILADACLHYQCKSVQAWWEDCYFSFKHLTCPAVFAPSEMCFAPSMAHHPLFFSWCHNCMCFCF